MKTEIKMIPINTCGRSHNAHPHDEQSSPPLRFHESQIASLPSNPIDRLPLIQSQMVELRAGFAMMFDVFRYMRGGHEPPDEEERRERFTTTVAQEAEELFAEISEPGVIRMAVRVRDLLAWSDRRAFLSPNGVIGSVSELEEILTAHPEWTPTGRCYIARHQDDHVEVFPLLMLGSGCEIPGKPIGTGVKSCPTSTGPKPTSRSRRRTGTRSRFLESVHGADCWAIACTIPCAKLVGCRAGRRSEKGQR
jgi:hypothetical protein